MRFKALNNFVANSINSKLSNDTVTSDYNYIRFEGVYEIDFSAIPETWCTFE